MRPLVPNSRVVESVTSPKSRADAAMGQSCATPCCTETVLTPRKNRGGSSGGEAIPCDGLRTFPGPFPTLMSLRAGAPNRYGEIFEYRLLKTEVDEPLGMEVRKCGGTVLVVSVTGEGAVQRCNSDAVARGEFPLEEGDSIDDVWDVRRHELQLSTEASNALKHGTSMRLTVRRTNFKL